MVSDSSAAEFQVTDHVARVFPAYTRTREHEKDNAGNSGKGKDALKGAFVLIYLFTIPEKEQRRGEKV